MSKPHVNIKQFISPRNMDPLKQQQQLNPLSAFGVTQTTKNGENKNPRLFNNQRRLTLRNKKQLFQRNTQQNVQQKQNTQVIQSPCNNKQLNELEQTNDLYDQKIFLNNYHVSKPQGKCYMTPQGKTQAFINNFAKENNLTKPFINNENIQLQHNQKTLNTLAEIKNQTREDTQIYGNPQEDQQAAATLRQISATFHISNNLKNLFDTKGVKRPQAIHSKDNTINTLEDNAYNSNGNTPINNNNSNNNGQKNLQGNNYYFVENNPGYQPTIPSSQRQDIIRSYDQIKFNQHRQTSRKRSNNTNTQFMNNMINNCANNNNNNNNTISNPNNNSNSSNAFSLPKKLTNLNNTNINFNNQSKNQQQQQQQQINHLYQINGNGNTINLINNNLNSNANQYNIQNQNQNLNQNQNYTNSNLGNPSAVANLTKYVNSSRGNYSNNNRHNNNSNVDVKFFSKRKTIYAEGKKNGFGNNPLNDSNLNQKLLDQERQLDLIIRTNNPNVQQHQAKQLRNNDICHFQETEPVSQEIDPNSKTRTISTYKSTTCQSNSNKASQQQDQVKKQHELEELLYTDTKFENYELGKVLGFGSYAIVRQATHKPTGLVVAIKSYDKKKLEDPMKRKNVEREIKNLSKLNHPNIVKLYQVLESQNSFHLIMEDASGMALNDFIKQKRQKFLSEDDGRFIMKQLCSALKYCHKKCIAHRDVKLENIIIDSMKRVKLIDFGFSIVIPPESKVNVFCGTPSYMSPEIVNKMIMSDEWMGGNQLQVDNEDQLKKKLKSKFIEQLVQSNR